MSMDGTRTADELKMEPVCHELFRYDYTRNEPFIRTLPNNSNMYGTFNFAILRQLESGVSDEETREAVCFLALVNFMKIE